MANALRFGTALAEVSGWVGREITALAEEVHAASSPLTWITGTPATGPARLVYRSIHGGFSATARLAALGGRVAGRDPAPDAWLDVQSALNGVFGHLFEQAGSHFALPASLHLRGSGPRRDRLLLFLHGLCMNERAWHNPTHERFVAWAEARLGARVAYLRYNTGLRISANGALLADLLERQTAAELILVGHSMGGLVALGALHQARAQGLDWPGRVTRVACLGSPHEGASLERLGNHANRMLRVSPWSRPFMRLGELRSDGIRDLRFGHVLEEDWRGRRADDPQAAPSRVRLAPHVEHLFVAASRAREGELDLVGDWLVSVGSAHARSLHPETGARRERLDELDHLGLLADERCYRLLQRWLDDGR
jgi:pimeloyl-ACP methyl ester carboxylesterase